MKRVLREEELLAFERFLTEQERSALTLEKYARDIRAFLSFAKGQEVQKPLVLAYKEHLSRTHTVSGANSMLAALNSLFRFLGWYDCTVKQFRVQRRAYCAEEKELTRQEYVRLVRTAERMGNERLSLILQTIGATGMRIGELPFVTVEAARKGEVTVRCKGKSRTVFLVSELRKKLLRYARAQGLEAGMIFVSRSGKALHRSNIWKEMKGLCERADVCPDKVFPHNLRHLFARIFYEMEKDIAKLADILGHSSINTTRIYIITTGSEHKRRMEHMRLIL